MTYVSRFSTAAAAEKGLEITKSLIDLAKIEGDLTKDITVYVAFDTQVIGY
jgi:alpha-N-arabinofuranosidase